LSDRGFFVYALQSVAVFEYLGVWQRNVDRLVDGEFEIECPTCSEHPRRERPHLPLRAHGRCTR